ncbi:MAG: hypothetical protein KC544_04010 [Gemmatimonadetes bacterium]|nr:hypothetical protein [Gemmatimonadota bacterium]
MSGLPEFWKTHRYIRVVEDLPEHDLKAGDLLEVPVDPTAPLMSYRQHGFDRSWVAVALADRVCDPIAPPRPSGHRLEATLDELRLRRAGLHLVRSS